MSVSVLMVMAVVWVAGGPLGWPRDRAVGAGFGLALAVMTITRPWWFWEHRKAWLLRRMVGDELTILSYLAVAAGMVWIGLLAND